MTDVQRSGVEHTARRLTLAIDIGGTGLKASVVDEAAQMITERVRLPTPVGAPPQQIVEVLAGMVTPLGAFDRVSVGACRRERGWLQGAALLLGWMRGQGLAARPRGF